MSKESELPARPHIPMSVYALVFCVFVERSVLRARPGWLAVGLLFALLGLAAILAFKRMRLSSFRETIAVCLVSAAAALLVSAFAAARATEGTKSLEEQAVSSFEFEICSDMVLSGSNYRGRSRAYLDGRELGEAWIVCPERLCRGDKLSCVGRFTSPGDDAWGDAERAEALLGSIKVVKILNKRPAAGAIAFLEGLRQQRLASIEPATSDAQALVAALSLGWRADMQERGLSELFSVCGISHVAAVSGTHVMVACALVGSILVRLRFNLRLRIALLIFVTGLFVLASGASASAVRAWLMCICAFSAQMAGRRADALSALGLCCLSMALIRPSLSGNIGFLLSLSCVFGLCIFAPYANYVIRTLVGPVFLPRFVRGSLRVRLTRAIRGLCQGFAAAIVAAIAALPIAASAFGKLSIIGPFVNALLAPAFTLLVGISLLVANTASFPLLQRALMAASGAFADALISALKACARLPNACISVELDLGVAFALTVAASVLLYALWPKVNRRIIGRALLAFVAFGLSVFVYWRIFAPARICVMDVGQGDAILVQDGSAAVLVDTGPDDAVARELSRLNVSHLDAVILTHLHDDHYGGLGALKGHVSCENVYVGAGAAENVPDGLSRDIEELTGSSAHEISYGDEFHVGSFMLKTIWPRQPAPGTQNEDSLVMLVAYQVKGCEFKALLTGDAEHEVLSDCIKHEHIEYVALLKVGHHGSEVSLSADDASRLRPELAIASAGKDNSYGHPSDVCANILRDAGSRFLCTKDVGTVIVEPQKGHLHVKTLKGNHEVE